MLEKSFESPLDCKEIQPVHPKGNQSWIFIGRADARVEVPILWPPDAKNWLIGKDLDAGKDWRQKEKGMAEDEMVGWLQQFHGHEFAQAQAVEGQGNLACSSLWGCEESDTNEWLNWTKLNYFCLQSFSASGSFPMSWLFTSGGESIRVSASASVLPINIQDWFPLGLTGLISLQSKELCKVFSPAPQSEHINSLVLRLLYAPTLTSILDS